MYSVFVIFLSFHSEFCIYIIEKSFGKYIYPKCYGNIWIGIRIL